MTVMKKNLFSNLLAFILVVFSINAFAQGYNPMRGQGVVAKPVGQGGICIGCYNGNLDALTNADLTDKVSMGNFTNLVSGNGISVKNTIHAYPAGYITGFKVDTGSSFLTVDLLNSLRVATYLNGQLQEESGSGALLSVPAFGGMKSTKYIHLRTTKAFDEVRLYQTTLTSVFSAMNVYYAFSFDPNKVPVEDNKICDDQIAGSGVDYILDAKGDLISLFKGVDNPQYLIDGNKNTAAQVRIPASILGTTSVGVLDKDQVYPAGVNAGWVIEPDDQGKILSAEFLKNVVIETYLYGQLQDSKTLYEGGGLINIKVLSFGSYKQKISLKTTKPFNEIRLKVNQTLGINIGTLKVYYAYEEPLTCNNCNEYLQTAGSSEKGNVVTGSSWTGTSGTIFGFTNLQNAGNVVDTNVNNYATVNIAPINILIPKVFETVANTAGKKYPAGTFAGFNVVKSGTLASLDFLSSVQIDLYNGTTWVGSQSGGGLFSGQLFVSQSNMYWVAMKAPKAFDRMKITFNAGATFGSGQQFYVYNAFVQIDSDGDGVPDCNDKCPNGDDSIDTNGDGIPDCLGGCSVINDKSNAIDTDGDGIKDACDLDSDNDVIPDSLEDANKNGLFEDDDVDGNVVILDFGDGIPNYRDLDSDNDGIMDLHESGIPASIIRQIDKDMNGVIDLNAGSFGKNGILDILETSPDSGVMKYPLADTNGDGTPDFLDIMSNGVTYDLYAIGKANLDTNFGGFIPRTSDQDDDGIMNPVDTKLDVRGAPGSPMSPYNTTVAPRGSLPAEEVAKAANDMKIHPNPVKAGENIVIDALSKMDTQYTIYSAVGSLVKSGTVGADAKISTSNLSSGVYILNIVSNGIMKSFKIIVQ